MEFTRVDRNLMLRVGLWLRKQAENLERQHGANWAASPEAKQAKRDYDRLRREERDLYALRQRLNGSSGAGGD